MQPKKPNSVVHWFHTLCYTSAAAGAQRGKKARRLIGAMHVDQDCYVEMYSAFRVRY